MTREKNRKFRKTSQAREAFPSKLADVIVRESAGDAPFAAVKLRKVVRESLQKKVSPAMLTRWVNVILADPYFRKRMVFTSVGRTWYVTLKNCPENVHWVRCLRARIQRTWKEHRELLKKDIRRLIRAMNFAYSEIAGEEKKKNSDFDPRYDNIPLDKIVRRAETKEEINLDRRNRRRITAIFRKCCAKRYIFEGDKIRLPMSESKRARAIIWASGNDGDGKSAEIDVSLFNRIKRQIIVSAKYTYANNSLLDPFYAPLPVGDILNKVLNRNEIKLNKRQKQRWVEWIVKDKYLSLFFDFSKRCIPNGTGNYKSSRHVLCFKSNQIRLRGDVFTLQKRFSRAREERGERASMPNLQTKRHISLRSKDSLYSFGSSTPGPKVSMGAKTLVRPPGDPPEKVQNPFESDAHRGGLWPPDGPAMLKCDTWDPREVQRPSCADLANSRLSALDLQILAASSRQFREKFWP